MTILSTFGCGSVGVDTGDIPASLRFRNAAASYCNRLFGSPASAYKWSFSTWVKLGNLGQRHFLLVGWNGASDRGYLEINDSGVLRYDDFYSSSQRCLKVSTPVYRDPTGWLHIVCEADTDNATAEDRLRIYVNGVRVTSWSTNTNYTISTATQINWASHQHYIGWLNSMYGDDYRARTAFVDNGGGGPTAYAQFNTEINEWVSKSQSAVKAVVDAGGTNSFMLDFDDPNFATYNVGKDYSSKGNHWTPNNFSLTAGTSYDRMLDVPGNSFATLNNIYPSAANITNGNLTSGTTAVRATMNALAFDSKWEVTAGGSAVTAGVISGTGTATTTSVTANKTFAFRLTTSGALDYKNVTDAGSWTSIATGLSGEQYPYGVTQAANWNFGQAPLHASATYQSAAGGYFYDTTSGFKALCQRNMPDGESITTSGSFTGTLAADGPYVDIKGVPTAMTINGNAVTFGTHVDKTSSGFKLRTASSSYNNTGSNTFSVTSTGPKRKYSLAQGNP